MTDSGNILRMKGRGIHSGGDGILLDLRRHSSQSSVLKHEDAHWPPKTLNVFTRPEMHKMKPNYVFLQSLECIHLAPI